MTAPLGYKTVHCSTCGKEATEPECDYCRQWWKDNEPSPMKLHLGATRQPMAIVTHQQGYWFKADGDERFTWVPSPRRTTKPVRKLFGLSFGKWYIGLIRFD